MASGTICEGAMIVEHALDAWCDCNPKACTTLPVEQLTDLLPQIAVHVPGGRESVQKGKKLHEVFTPLSRDHKPLFLKMIKTQNGQVQFLHFWRAFSEACRYVAAVDGTLINNDLAFELETLRDEVLRLLERESKTGAKHLRKKVAITELVEVVNRAGSMSSQPSFWHQVQLSLQEATPAIGTPEIGLEQLTVVVLSWLYEAMAWQGGGGSPQSVTDVDSLKLGKRLSVINTETERQTLSVHLNIYDVSRDDRIQQINRVFAYETSPLKFGGVFHAGVEIEGLEWQYGCSRLSSTPGVSCGEPRHHPQHHFRQTVRLRRTKFSSEDISSIISDMIEEYPGHDYDVLRRNCCHFADDFCMRLGVGPIPGWVHRLAYLGARVENVIHMVTGASVTDRLSEQ